MEAKDYVAIATGVIGCAAGLTALVRGWFLDRRLYWEPYFEKKWKQISAPLGNNVKTTNGSLTMLDKDLSGDDLRDLAIGSSVPPPYDNIDWTYDRRLEKQLKSYTSALDNLRRQLRHYNMLVSLLDEKTYLDLQIKNVFMSSEEVHVTEEARESYTEKKQKIIDLIKYYAGSIDISFHDLKANRYLAADIQKSKIAIELSIATVRPLLTTLQAAIDFYDAKFSI